MVLTKMVKYVKNNQIAALKTNSFEFSSKFYIRNIKQNTYIPIGIAMKWNVLKKYAQKCEIYEDLCKLGICKWVCCIFHDDMLCSFKFPSFWAISETDSIKIKNLRKNCQNYNFYVKYLRFPWKRSNISATAWLLHLRLAFLNYPANFT
jgi:hypothetical protein